MIILQVMDFYLFNISSAEAPGVEFESLECQRPRYICSLLQY